MDRIGEILTHHTRVTCDLLRQPRYQLGQERSEGGIGPMRYRLPAQNVFLPHRAVIIQDHFLPTRRASIPKRIFLKVICLPTRNLALPRTRSEAITP